MNQSPYFSGKKKKSPRAETPMVAVAKKKQTNSSNNDGRDDDKNTDGENGVVNATTFTSTSAENNKMRDDLLLKLRPFQREAYEFATKGKSTPRQFDDGKKDDFQYDAALLGKGRILLADEMGLGKTVTSLAIMTHYRQEWPLLILCPASLRHTWPCEIEKFLPSLPASAIYVVSGFDDADFLENPRKKKEIQIVVATYSLLQTRSAAAKVLEQFKFQCVICDESHNLKQRTSQRTKLALPLLQTAKRLVLLSGTPALARPVELWTQIYSLAPELFGTYPQFTKQYCNARRGRFGWDVNGLSNAEELHQKLRQVMVRRLKSDVLKELPPKQRSMVPIPIAKGKRKECQELMQELKDTRQSVSELAGDEASSANFDARRLLMQAYQASGVAKAAGICDYLIEWLQGSGNQKVLVFGHHKALLDALEVAVSKELKGSGHIRIDGQVPPNERAARVRKFQTCPRVRVGILSMTAAGVGLTLTAATTVMFGELHWTPGVLAQAEDRCHRIGQSNAVNILYFVCQDQSLSVDMQLWNMLGRKIGTLGKVVDGCKNASLNAQVAETGDIVQAGKSVQDELQSFFADTSPHATGKPKVPVKGTIMSFFQKQIAATETDNNKPEASPEASSSDVLANRTTRSSSVTKTGPHVEWACETCTFENSKPRPKSRLLTCEMCTSVYMEPVFGQGASPITPPSTSKASPSTETVVLLDIEVLEETEMLSSQNSSTDPIVIDDDPKIPISQSMKPRELNPPDCVVIADSSIASSKKRRRSDMVVLEVAHPTGKRSIVTPHSKISQHEPILIFSVSKNSGRITIHYATDGKSSHVNFDLEQVVSKETADSLLDTKVSCRSASKVATVVVEFDEDAIGRVIHSLDCIETGGESRKHEMRQELKDFVTNYLGLREVEKKAIKDSGEPFAPYQLRRIVLGMMTSSIGNGSMERYSGGAKERARENIDSGNATQVDMDILEGKMCAWCGGHLPRASKVAGVQSTYCSRECAENGRLQRGGMYASTQVRAQVFALEGGVCRLCGIDAHALYIRISALQPAERLNALCNANWKLPKTPKALERLLQDPKEGDFWQADHIVAVAEGGGGCGLDNLRTLCVPCHTGETERLRARLRLSGGAQRKDSSCDNQKQRDIRSMFQAKAL